MPGLFDRLQKELGGDDDSSGISPLDIADLPEDQKRILLWMLRDRSAGSDGVTADVLQSKLENAPKNCASILKDLARSGWVIGLGEPPNLRFKVNLRRKRGSNAGFGLWSIINDRLPDDQ
jgi:hypothetical protein